jgi:hypothetical protein
MKITPKNNINEILPKDIHKSEKTSDSTFENILNNKIEDLKVAKPGIEESLPVNKTANLLLIPPVEEKEAISRLEKFLDIMEEYSEKLNNPNFTPKDISTLISKIESEQRDLSVLAESFDKNNELKGLLDAALIRSTTEVIKFNRGDYL